MKPVATNPSGAHRLVKCSKRDLRICMGITKHCPCLRGLCPAIGISVHNLRPKPDGHNLRSFYSLIYRMYHIQRAYCSSYTKINPPTPHTQLQHNHYNFQTGHVVTQQRSTHQRQELKAHNGSLQVMSSRAQRVRIMSSSVGVGIGTTFALKRFSLILVVIIKTFESYTMQKFFIFSPPLRLT